VFTIYQCSNPTNKGAFTPDFQKLAGKAKINVDILKTVSCIKLIKLSLYSFLLDL